MPRWKHGLKGSPIVKHLFLVLAALLVSGCKEDFPVYAAFEKGGVLAFECLDYAVTDDTLRTRITTTLKKPHVSECKYKLQLIRYHVGKCDNPFVKSIGSDFDGYVRIEVHQGFDLLYKVQSDFKNDPDAALERVLERAKKDIGSHKDT